MSLRINQSTPAGITVTTPWERPPLTANQRFHWRKTAAIVKDVRRWAALSFSGVQVLARPAIVQLDWHVPDKRRRDADNLVPTLKALCDGLVDAYVVPDDTPDLMDKRMPRIIHTPGQKARLVLTVTGAADV